MPTCITPDNLSIFFYDEGNGTPLLLIHGFPFSSEQYRPQRAALRSRFRVITPDLRGVGQSTVPPGSYSMDVYANDMIAVLDHLDIPQAIVGGASMGGYIAFALLRQHPERFKGLLLLGTRATADSAEGKALRYKLIDQARTDGPAAVADALLPWMLTEQTRRDQPDLTMFVRDMMASVPVDGMVGALDAMATRPDSTPLLADIRVPTYIIAGSDDRVVPVSVAEELQQAIPQARLTIVQGASQAANLERAADINQLITTWAAQLN